MPRSMTGFARLEKTLAQGTLVWELRSVNHRYLELQFRLPDTLRELEPGLREKLRKNLVRGKVEAILAWLPDKGSAPQGLQLDTNLVAELAAALDAVTSTLKNPAKVDPVQVLRWPGVIRDNELDRELLLKEASALFDAVLQELIAHRQREGTQLMGVIEEKVVAISESVADIRLQLPSILLQQRQRLVDKLNTLAMEVDQNRLEQELLYITQKADIAEELDRIDTHLGEVRHTLKQKGGIGRRLDFLMQELNREANTLSSKSIVSETSLAAVQLKVLIEQMREQIQNIE